MPLRCLGLTRQSAPHANAERQRQFPLQSNYPPLSGTIQFETVWPIFQGHSVLFHPVFLCLVHFLIFSVDKSTSLQNDLTPFFFFSPLLKLETAVAGF